VREIIADRGFSKRFVGWVRCVCGWEVTTTATAARGFKVHPRRWVVERTLGWLVSYRRLGKDYECLTETSEAMIRVAMIHLMLRRLKPLPQFSDALVHGHVHRVTFIPATRRTPWTPAGAPGSTANRPGR
jgi:hypothetical protein